MSTISDGTWVQIKKPEIPLSKWKREWKQVCWDSHMDKYNNKSFIVKKVKIKDKVKVYKLSKTDGYNWHHDWLIPLKTDKDGNPIPNDNQERKDCYWCKEKTKTKVINFKKTEKKYTYCPKCLR
jgi:hypothetical protein